MEHNENKITSIPIMCWSHILTYFCFLSSLLITGIGYKGVVLLKDLFTQNSWFPFALSVIVLFMGPKIAATMCILLFKQILSRRATTPYEKDHLIIIAKNRISNASLVSRMIIVVFVLYTVSMS